jgi:hypothetical protein
MSANTPAFLKRLWLALALLHAATVAHLILYVLFGEDRGRSLSFRILALGVMALALGVIGFTVWFNDRRLETIRRLARPLFWPVIAGSLAILMAYGALIRPEWFYAHLAVTLASTLSLIYYTLYADRIVPRRILVAVGVALFLLVVGIRVSNLNYYPPLDINDEPWTLSWAISYLRTGTFTSTILYKGGQDTQLFYIPMAYWMRIFGTGLWTGRLFNLCLTLIVTILGVLTAHNLYDNRAALFTGLALFASAALMAGARLRHDIGLALAIASSLYTYSEAIRRQSVRLHVLAGVLMGWGWFAHYHAILFGVAMTVGLYGPRYLDRRRAGKYWPEKEMWLYVLGGILGAVTVILIQILPQWEDFRGRVFHGSATLTLADLGERISSHFLSIAEHSQVEFLLIVTGIIAALARRLPFDRALVTMVLLGHLGLGLTIPADYYIVA